MQNSSPRPLAHARARRRGFTLIEIMIAVAIVAIVASLGVPAFFDSIRKSRRAEAVAALTAVQQQQERRRANEPAYTTDLSALALATTTASGYYTISIDAAGATGYTATASAVTGTSQASDTNCKQLRVKLDRGNILYGSACSACSLADPPTDPKRCWSRQ